MQLFILTFLLIAASVVLGVTEAEAFMQKKGQEGDLIISKHVPGAIEIKNGKIMTETDLITAAKKSQFGHNISITSVNNDTHVFYFLEWNDKTRGTPTDGIALIFNHTSAGTRNGEKLEFYPQEDVIWFWSSNGTRVPSEIFVDSSWEDGKWHVVMGGDFSEKNIRQINFGDGITKNNFVKFVAWDGSKGQFYSKIEYEKLPFADFVLFPEIEKYENDVYVYGGLLTGAIVLFLIIDTRFYKKKEDKKMGGDLQFT